MSFRFVRVGDHKVRRSAVVRVSRAPGNGAIEIDISGSVGLIIRAGRDEYPAALALYESIEADDPGPAPPAPPGPDLGPLRRLMHDAANDLNVVFPRAELLARWLAAVGVVVPEDSDPGPAMEAYREKVARIWDEVARLGGPPRSVGELLDDDAGPAIEARDEPTGRPSPGFPGVPHLKGGDEPADAGQAPPGTPP